MGSTPLCSAQLPHVHEGILCAPTEDTCPYARIFASLTAYSGSHSTFGAFHSGLGQSVFIIATVASNCGPKSLDVFVRSPIFPSPTTEFGIFRTMENYS